MVDAFEYIVGQGGFCLESDYPYIGSDGVCQNSCKKVVKPISCVDVPEHVEDYMKILVAYVGPLSIGVDADPWMSYTKGVFQGPCNPGLLDHGVTLVGYGVEKNSTDSVPYWIIKNSWGADWGEDGYIRIERGVNKCGITQYVSYPVFG